MTYQTAPTVSHGVTIATYGVGDDMVILLDDLALVSSKSEPTRWRPVEHGVCYCPGYQLRARCRHVDAVKGAEELDRATAETVIPTIVETLTTTPPAPSGPLCTDCGKKPAKVGPRCCLCHSRFANKVMYGWDD